MAAKVVTVPAVPIKIFILSFLNGTLLTKNRLWQLSEELLSLPFDQRAKLSGLEPGRADIIVAELLAVREILEHFFQETLLVSGAGLLEGMIV